MNNTSSFEKAVTKMADPLVKKLDSTELGKKFGDQMEKFGAVVVTLMTNRNVREDTVGGIMSGVAAFTLTMNPAIAVAFGIVTSRTGGDIVRAIANPERINEEDSGITILARALKTGKVPYQEPSDSLSTRVENVLEKLGAVTITFFKDSSVRKSTIAMLSTGALGFLLSGGNPMGFVIGAAAGGVARHDLVETFRKDDLFAGADALARAWRTGTYPGMTKPISPTVPV